jgi:hypothetical protein
MALANEYPQFWCLWLKVGLTGQQPNRKLHDASPIPQKSTCIFLSPPLAVMSTSPTLHLTIMLVIAGSWLTQGDEPSISPHPGSSLFGALFPSVACGLHATWLQASRMALVPQQLTGYKCVLPLSSSKFQILQRMSRLSYWRKWLSVWSVLLEL